MADKDSFALYFSHSWRPRDVDLNVSVWKALCGQCQMLVDVPDEPGANPPYYVHRIEERLQRSDLFVSVLTLGSRLTAISPRPMGSCAVRRIACSRSA